MLEVRQNVDENSKPSSSFIFHGSARLAMTKKIDQLTRNESGSVISEVLKFTVLENLNPFLPLYFMVGPETMIPELETGHLTENPHADKKLVLKEMSDVFVKNIEIKLEEGYETRLISYFNDYRSRKYKPELNQSIANCLIKNRKLRVAMHNSITFVGHSSITGAISLKKENNILNYKGVLHLDYFHENENVAFYFELVYQVTIPLPKKTEETVTISIGYALVLPEKITFSDNISLTNLITGPGVSIIGDSLYEPSYKKDRLIKFGCLISKDNSTTEQTSLTVENQRLKEKINETELEKEKMRKTYANEKDKVLLSKEEEIKRMKEQLEKERLDKLKLQKEQDERDRRMLEKSQEMKGTIFKIDEITETKSQPLLHESDSLVDPMTGLPREIERKEISDKRFTPREQANDKFRNTGTLRNEDVAVINEDRQTLKNSASNFPQLDKSIGDSVVNYRTENRQFNNLDYFRENYKDEPRMYYTLSKEMSKKEKADLISQGLYEVMNKDVTNEFLAFTLDKELNDKFKAYHILIQFLSFKSLNQSDFVPDSIYIKFNFWDYTNYQTETAIVNKPKNATSFTEMPLMLTKQTEVFDKNTDKEIKYKIEYDPSVDPFTDFKDFLKYMLENCLSIEVYDADKGFLIGTTRIELKDCIRQGKPSVSSTKDFTLLDVFI